MKAASSKTSLAVRRFPLTKAMTDLGDLVQRVHHDKVCVILEKDGVPVAGLLDIDEVEDYLELKDQTVRQHIRKSHEEYMAGKSRPAAQLLDNLRKSRATKPKGMRRQTA
jgi:hypothetical protein